VTTRARGWTIAALVAAVTVLVTSIAWTASWATTGGTAVSGQFGPAWPGGDRTATDQGAAASDLPGTVVDVVAADMGGRGMMGGSGGSGGWMGGRMMLRTDRVDVSAGTVTLRLTNAGSVDHELVVLPLAVGQQIGERAVSADGTVDESDSLGEASRTNGAGAGDGIEPGTTGWVTLDLAPGRYELVCNLPGHYAAGMYTLLVVR